MEVPAARAGTAQRADVPSLEAYVAPRTLDEAVHLLRAGNVTWCWPASQMAL
jgi:hypothetical protein